MGCSLLRVVHNLLTLKELTFSPCSVWGRDFYVIYYVTGVCAPVVFCRGREYRRGHYARPGLQGLPMERRCAKYSSSVARAILVTEQEAIFG